MIQATHDYTVTCHFILLTIANTCRLYLVNIDIYNIHQAETEHCAPE